MKDGKPVKYCNSLGKGGKTMAKEDWAKLPVGVAVAWEIHDKIESGEIPMPTKKALADLAKMFKHYGIPPLSR